MKRERASEIALLVMQWQFRRMDSVRIAKQLQEAAIELGIPDEEMIQFKHMVKSLDAPGSS